MGACPEALGVSGLRFDKAVLSHAQQVCYLEPRHAFGSRFGH